MNITEKILARASGQNTVAPDDVIFASVDKVMMHDVSGPGVIKVFDKLKNQGVDTSKLHDPSKVWVAEDHFVPTAEKINSGETVRFKINPESLHLFNIANETRISFDGSV